ncbi:MAG: tetratricopeptide repeat protein [Bryobacterales bacterium]|nr:tetratricopeptide repeat protein [Bryobacterales bacterium]
MLHHLILAAALLQSPGQRAAALVDAGIELSHRGRFGEAADKFVQALALDPGIAEAHYLLGLIRQQDGRTEAALQSFHAALRINPRHAPAQARVCELDTVFARARETGYEKGLDSCRRAIQLDPGDAEPRFHIGWIQAKLGNHAAAIREFTAVLRLDPKFSRVRFELAMAYIDTKDDERALPLLKEVLAAEPGNGNARFQLGSALARKGDCGRAVPWLESATESAQKHYLLAGCFKRMNRETEAASEFAKVKESREGAEASMQARYLAAAAQREAAGGDLDKAIAGYRAALALVKDSTIAIDLAVALLKRGEAQEVVRMLGEETDPLARYQVALAYSKLGRADEARSVLERVVREKPGFVEAWYQLGVNSLTLAKHEEAGRALGTAVRLRPDEAAFRLAWAEALEKLGKAQDAREQRRLAAKLPK